MYPTASLGELVKRIVGVLASTGGIESLEHMGRGRLWLLSAVQQVGEVAHRVVDILNILVGAIHIRRILGRAGGGETIQPIGFRVISIGKLNAIAQGRSRPLPPSIEAGRCQDGTIAPFPICRRDSHLVDPTTPEIVHRASGAIGKLLGFYPTQGIVGNPGLIARVRLQDDRRIGPVGLPQWVI